MFFVPKAKKVSQCVAAKPLVNLRIYNYSHYPHHITVKNTIPITLTKTMNPDTLTNPN